MNKYPPYWHWENALPEALCKIILADRRKLQEQAGLIGEGDKVHPDVRKSTVCWAPQNHWLEGVLYNYGLYANESAGWNFQVGRPEPVQLTSYSKGEFYEWHQDAEILVASPVIRKVSVVALLNDPCEFEGGVFEFEGSSVEMKRGDVIAFPSLLRHRVTPVSKGRRYSAVCWINGPRTL